MAHTLGTAAKATGKSKTTIFRAIVKGKISAEKDVHGRWAIDPGELHRVYPAVDSERGDGPSDGEMAQYATGRDTGVLQREMDLLREMLADRDRQITDLRGDRDQWRQQATALLGDPRSGRRPWWRFW